MPDDKVRVQISTEFDGQGSKEAVAATKSLANETAKATDKTNKWSLSKKALATNLGRLTKEFPLLGAAGRLALNPILIAAAGAAWIFKKVSDEVQALTDYLKDLQKAEQAFHQSNVDLVQLLEDEAKKALANYRKEYGYLKDAKETAAKAADEQITKIESETAAYKSQIDAMLELVKLKIENSGMTEEEKAVALVKVGGVAEEKKLAADREEREKKIAVLVKAVTKAKEEQEKAEAKIVGIQDKIIAQQSAIKEAQDLVTKTREAASQDLGQEGIGGFFKLVKALTFASFGVKTADVLKMEEKQAAERQLPQAEKTLREKRSEADVAKDQIAIASKKREEFLEAEERLKKEKSKADLEQQAQDEIRRIQKKKEASELASAQAKLLLKPGADPRNETQWNAFAKAGDVEAMTPAVADFVLRQRKIGRTEDQIATALAAFLESDQKKAALLVATDRRLTMQMEWLRQRMKYAANVGGPS